MVNVLTYPVPEDTLQSIALEFLRENRRKEYRQLKASGELDEALALKVENCQRQAKNLMATGLWENEAWNRAIRSEILESESE